MFATGVKQPSEGEILSRNKKAARNLENRRDDGQVARTKVSHVFRVCLHVGKVTRHEGWDGNSRVVREQTLCFFLPEPCVIVLTCSMCV